MLVALSGLFHHLPVLNNPLIGIFYWTIIYLYLSAIEKTKMKV